MAQGWEASDLPWSCRRRVSRCLGESRRPRCWAGTARRPPTPAGATGQHLPFSIRCSKDRNKLLMLRQVGAENVQ